MVFNLATEACGLGYELESKLLTAGLYKGLT